MGLGDIRQRTGVLCWLVEPHPRKGDSMQRFACWLTVAAVQAFLFGAPLLAQDDSADCGWTFQTPQFDVLVTRDLVYVQTASRSVGHALRLDLYQPGPDSHLPNERPAMLVIHGGAFIQGDKRNESAVAMCLAFAARGYVCMSIDYRLLRELPAHSTQHDAAMAAVEDAHAALAWLQTNALSYQIDTSRLVIDGQSAGAITALLCSYTDIVAPRAEVAAVVDQWGSLEMYVREIQADDPALFIVHGERDPIVLFANAVALHERAEQVGLRHAFYPIPDAGHGVNMNESIGGKTLIQHVAGFLAEVLGYTTNQPQTELQ
jgi:acetyl esterase/lipase